MASNPSRVDSDPGRLLQLSSKVDELVREKLELLSTNPRKQNKALERWLELRPTYSELFDSLFSMARLWVRDGLTGASFDKAVAELEAAQSAIASLINVLPEALTHHATEVFDDGHEERRVVFSCNEIARIRSLGWKAQESVSLLMRWRDLVRSAAPPPDKMPLTPAEGGDVFAELLSAIDKADLSKTQAKVVRVVAERKGCVLIVDAHTLCDCDAVSAFKKAAKKLRKYGWHLHQKNSALVAKPNKQRGLK